MTDLSRYLEKLNIEIKKINYFTNYIVINDKYLVVKKNNKIIDYLKSINYEYCNESLDNSDQYELYDYEEEYEDKEVKEKELLKGLLSLHQKTIIEIENKEEIDKLYEELKEKIDERMKYYLDLHDYIEEIEYFNPEEYLLIKNLSKFYHLLRLARYKLDNWYQNSNNKYREVLLLGNVSLNNFIFGNKSYFISFDRSTRGNIVYDLVDFYQNEMLDFNYLFEEYNILNDNEKNLFYSLISIMPKIKFTNNHYDNTLNTRKIIDYIDNTLYLLEEDEKNQETNKDEFKEENNDIELSSDKQKNN